MALKTSARLYPVKENFISVYELEDTELLLKNMKSSEGETALLLVDWVEQRLKSIESIDNLEEKFDKCHRACNIAHGAGSAMEIIGGVAMVAGAILTACGHKTVGELLTKKVSPITAGAGVATSVCSSLADAGITYSTMREAQKVLEKDEKYTQKLQKTLQDSKMIDSNLRRIFNCSILSDIFLVVVELCRECIPLLEVGYNEISKLKQVIKRNLKGRKLNVTDISDYTEIIIKNVCIAMKNISTDRKARDAIKKICDIIHDSPSSIEFIKLGLKLSLQICDVLQVDVFSSLLGFGVLKSNVGVMATNCLLGSVLIAVNVLSLISVVKNAQESSKYSKALKQLSLTLTFELNSVRKKYVKLFENGN